MKCPLWTSHFPLCGTGLDLKFRNTLWCLTPIPKNQWQLVKVYLKGYPQANKINCISGVFASHLKYCKCIQLAFIIHERWWFHADCVANFTPDFVGKRWFQFDLRPHCSSGLVHNHQPYKMDPITTSYKFGVLTTLINDLKFSWISLFFFGPFSVVWHGTLLIDPWLCSIDPRLPTVGSRIKASALIPVAAPALAALIMPAFGCGFGKFRGNHGKRWFWYSYVGKKKGFYFYFSHKKVSTEPRNIWVKNCRVFSTGWWFQIFFIFTPIWGRFPFWLIFVKWVETTN